MATEISSLGKAKMLSMLFEGSGFINGAGRCFSGRKNYATVHKLFMEGVDFDLTYTPMKLLGRRISMNVIGGLYSSLHSPVAMDFAVAVSNRFSYEDIRDLWEGVVQTVGDYGVKHLSLDLLPSAAGLSVSVSARGEQDPKFLSGRKDAQSMDLILLSGDMGAAYMGLHVLEREKVAFKASGQTSKQPDLSKYKYVVGEYLNPYIAPGIPKRFVQAGLNPSHGYLVNYGLGDALKKLNADTSLGVKVYLDKIPLASATLETARELDIDPVTAAVNGGGDCRLIYVVPMSEYEKARHDFQDFDIIGHLAQPEVGTVLVTPEGAEMTVRAQGYEEPQE